MVPSSRHPRLDPGPPLWKGTTHLLRLNSQIYSEARHLLHDKPNRVTLNVFQPFFARKQPLIRACLTEHSSWALRKYTLPQVSRMNDLTIRIPYFEWRAWPEHSLVFGDVLSRFEEMAGGQRRHQSEISRQLYILAAAVSHNPHLRRLTLAFRRWKAYQGRDNVDPDAAVYTYLQKALEPLVRFRSPDFDIRAISYEPSIVKNADQHRIELLAPWFNTARADWVRQVRTRENGLIDSENPLDIPSASKLVAQSDPSHLEVSLTPTALTEFDSWVPREMWEHANPCHGDRRIGIQYYSCGNARHWEGKSTYCVRCHREVFHTCPEREEPGKYRQHGEDGEEWDGPCVDAEDGDGRHDYEPQPYSHYIWSQLWPRTEF
jgi:hypothetical protein